MNLPTVKTFPYVDLGEITPVNWLPHFYARISEDAPFSWGDNNLTLVTAERFKNHVEDVLDKNHATDEELWEYNEFMKLLDILGSQSILINLES